MARLIINADDLGIHPEIDRGIIDAFRSGLLTSATLLVTTPYFGDALAKTILATKLPVGLHLSLSYGKAICRASQIPDLVDTTGRFRRSAAAFINASARSGALYDQIRMEFDAQIALARARGIHPTHLDSHQHVHMNPIIFQIVEELATCHNIRAMRFVHEPFFAFELRHRPLANLVRLNPLKVALLDLKGRKIKPRLATNDAFFGLMFSGNLDKSSFLSFLRAIAVERRVWEIGLHPGHYVARSAQEPDGRTVHPFIASPWREHELNLLLDPDVREIVKREQISLISYANLTTGSPALLP